MTDQELATLLLGARQTGTPVPTGPAPSDAAQAYRVQRLVMAELGEIGGWKVGASGPEGPISCAPMPAQGVFDKPVVLDSTLFTQRDVESEICFRLKADLPPREAPYGALEIMDAVASCHPGIEVLQSRYAKPEDVGPLALLADFIQTGAFVVGDRIESAALLHDFQVKPFVWRLKTADHVKQTTTPGVVKTADANPAGDMIRLIQWLADVGAVWAGGLRAGQIVTCGSWTGKTPVPAGGNVNTEFEGANPLTIHFTPLSEPS